jgi:hypothetical protein
MEWQRVVTQDPILAVDGDAEIRSLPRGYAELFPGFFVYTKAAALGLQAEWISAIEERCPLA